MSGYGPPPGQPGYPPPGQPGYPPPGQPGYPPPGQPGYGPPPGPPADMSQVSPQVSGIPGCPPGLEYLTQVDQLLVKQVVTLLEAFTAWECKDKFKIMNTAGQEVFFAGEESDTCERVCCRQSRGFIQHVTDNYGREVLRVKRDFQCCAGCCWCACLDCCSWEIAIEAPVDTTIGYITQDCSVASPAFTIMNAEREPVLKITGPLYCCMCQCPCFDLDFNVENLEGKVIGTVSRKWAGLAKEAFTQADNFGISFPMDLDVKIKGILIGAVFMINMMFFEQQQNQNQHN